MSKLHKLPNGNWLDLSTVNFIRVFPRRTEAGSQWPDTVNLSLDGTMSEEIKCASLEEAQKLADELAGLVNVAALQAAVADLDRQLALRRD